MNDKKETMDDLRDYRITKGKEKSEELYNELKNYKLDKKCEILEKKYGIIKINQFDFKFYNVGKDCHENFIKNKIENEFENTRYKNKKNRKNESKNYKYYKKENWVAKFAVEDSIVNKRKFCIGTIFDYEVPTGGEKKKNIDLLSYDEKEKTLRIIELKEDNSTEYFKAIIELLDYYILSKGYNLKNCELIKHPYLKGKEIEKIKMTILAYSDSPIVRYYGDDKYTIIKDLMGLFDIEIYEYKTKKHKTNNEDIIIDSINKLK